MAIPIGTVICYSLQQADQASEIAESWLACDGTSYARNKYSDLFNTIGGAFGTDGETNFYVPDLRGYFLRSPNDGFPRDPDAASRTAMAANGNTGDKIGSVQSDCVEWHIHQLENTWGAFSGGNQTVKDNQGITPKAQSHTATFATTETRPLNAAFAYFILAANPSHRMPMGAVVAYASAEDPVDVTQDGDVWVKCDGQALSRSTYPDFYFAFSDVLGPGDGSSTFNVPDFRGVFLRGVDPTGTRDPGMANRIPMFTTTTGAASVGSLQASQFASHYHVVHGDTQVSHNSGGTQVMSSNNDGGDSCGPTDATGDGLGAETRPKNAYLYQIIRVK
jgi:microcystin-dependent protein